MNKPLTAKEIHYIVLAIEALLIAVSLLTGGKSIIGMACYWALVAIYHLMDFIDARYSDGE